MKIIVLNFENYTVDLVSRGNVCRTYCEKVERDGELVPLYEYDEKKRRIVCRSEEEPVVVEEDIGPKKAKQWFLESTLRYLEDKNGPIWVFFDRASAMSQLTFEVDNLLEKSCANLNDVATQLKALNEMFKAVLKMEDPN